MAIMKTLTVNGTTYNVVAPIPVVDITLAASAWVGEGNRYSQVVPIAGVTENSQVNLTPSVEQLDIFYEKDITFVTENDGGVVTVYVIGQKPQNDYTIPANIVQVNDGIPMGTGDGGDSRLPKVTEDDNGKFLGVADGEWKAVDLNLGSGGGCQLPDVTDEANGKVPQVVDGALVYKDVADLQIGDKSLPTYIADAVNTYIEEALGGDY